MCCTFLILLYDNYELASYGYRSIRFLLHFIIFERIQKSIFFLQTSLGSHGLEPNLAVRGGQLTSVLQG